MRLKVELVVKVLGLILIFIVTLGQGSADTNNSYWCYNNPVCGPQRWTGICRTGQHQSPIDLSQRNGKSLTRKRVNMTSEYCHPHENFTIRNNGHSVEIRLADEAHPDSHAFSGEGFPDDYVFSHVHLHWGPTDDTGSEHAIDHKRYAMEMHVVHQKWDHQSKKFYESSGADTIAVFGIVFETDESFKDNPALAPIISVLPNVNKTLPNKTIALNGTRIDFMALFPDDVEVFRYNGSLTTPPCSERVMWTVFRQKAQVSKKQMREIRSLLMPDGTPFKDNARPIQPYNGRSLDIFPFKIQCEKIGRFGRHL